MTNLSSLDELNLDPTLDYTNSLNSLLNNDNDNPYNLYNIHSKYYDNPASPNSSEIPKITFSSV